MPRAAQGAGTGREGTPDGQPGPWELLSNRGEVLSRFSFLKFQAFISRKRCSQGSLAEVLLAALWQP